MTTTKNSTALTGKSVEDYIAEATKAPFRLPYGDGQVLEIPQPTNHALFLAEQEFGGRESFVKLLGEDVMAKLEELTNDAPAGTLGRITADIRKHFGLGE